MLNRKLCTVEDRLGYRAVNRSAWGRLASLGSDSSRPFVGTPPNPAQWLDPFGWIPWFEIKEVLCVAAAGGQQVPCFAALGRNVTLVDLSPDQLDIDRSVARRNGTKVETLTGDMLDLARLHGRQFDLVYQPVSACYVPNVRRLYREIAKVLRPAGYLWIEHWNPYHMQLSPEEPWNGAAYCLAEPQSTRRPIALPWTTLDAKGQEHTQYFQQFIHPLRDLVGGLGGAGFEILHFEERLQGNSSALSGTQPHQRSFVPPLLAIFARLGSHSAITQTQ